MAYRQAETPDRFGGCGTGPVLVAWAELQHIQQISLLQSLHKLPSELLDTAQAHTVTYTVLQWVDSVTYCTTGADSAQTVPQCAVPCCAVSRCVVPCCAVQHMKCIKQVHDDNVMMTGYPVPCQLCPPGPKKLWIFGRRSSHI
jgi:hypothetical protein